MKYAVIQRGTNAVFGIGDSYDEAVADAAKWLCDSETGAQGISVEDAENMISDERVVGAIAVIDSDDDEWSDYVTE